MAVKENPNRLKVQGSLEVSPAPSHEVRQQVDAIVRSAMFRNAPALQRLLQYVTLKTIEGKHVDLKEYTIGVEAFDRGQDYDPKIDTVVRVEMHRLRQKLKDYYESEGAEDPIVIEIPRGHYVPTFKICNGSNGKSNGTSILSEPVPQAEGSPDQQPETAEPGEKAIGAHRKSFFPRLAIIVLASSLLFLLGVVAGHHWTAHAVGNPGAASLMSGNSGANANNMVHNFWTSFLGKDNRPIIVYANAVFLIDESEDMFRFRHGASDNRGAPVDPHLAQEFASNSRLIGRAGPLFYEYGYSGIGDVQSVYRFTRLFTNMGYGVIAERCRLLTIDDLREHNVVLLGSSFQNDAVAQLPHEGDFIYKATPDPVHSLWGGVIINLHPRPGEAAVYRTVRDPATKVVKTDYGLVTIEPGITPNHYIATVGALDTSGVMGATQYLTSESGLSELMKRLQAAGEKVEQDRPPYFQALLKVDVENGLDVFQVRLVTVHPIPLGKTAGTAVTEHRASKPN
jgi:hypothetical protein